MIVFSNNYVKHVSKTVLVFSVTLAIGCKFTSLFGIRYGIEENVLKDNKVSFADIAWCANWSFAFVN